MAPGAGRTTPRGRGLLVAALVLLVAAAVTVRLERDRLLVHAASRGELSAVGALLRAGADPASARGGTHPLYAAISRGQHEAAELLLASGSPVDAAEPDGATPLMMAATKGDDRAVALLLSRGASTRAAMGCGNALDLALANGRESTAKLLRAAGATPSRDGMPHGR
jgi:ankyrin repeat protein